MVPHLRRGMRVNITTMIMTIVGNQQWSKIGWQERFREFCIIQVDTLSVDFRQWLK